MFDKNTTGTQQQFCTVCGKAANQNPASDNFPEKLVRKFGTSKLYLTYAILFSIFIVLNLVSFASSAFDLVNSLSYSYYSWSSDIYDTSIIYLIIEACVQFVTWVYALAIWLHYAACRKADRTPTTGLTILKVILIIEAVSFITLILLVLFALLVTLFVTSYHAEFLTQLVYLIVFFVFAIPITAIVEIYYFKMVSAINKAKAMIKKGTLHKMPTYVIVWNFILIVLALALPVYELILYSLYAPLFFDASAIIESASVLIAILALLIETVLMIRFNATVKKQLAQTEAIHQEVAVSPSEAATAILVQDADEIIDAQTDSEETVEDMPQA